MSTTILSFFYSFIYLNKSAKIITKNKEKA